ncbi:DUF3021 domain-containing protein [Anaerolentibacter hominis]|uniref:DUF3021 domain-containing protein n=1 Tax=Anaerolentibacter hominis TaxID=3079009 RepID=UPI0031B808A4
MVFHDILKRVINGFFIINTGILISMILICLLFHPEAAFSVAELSAIPLLALMCSIPTFLFWSYKREVSKKQMLARTIVHWLIIEALVMFCAYRWDWIDEGSTTQAIVFVIVIFAVYMTVWGCTLLNEKKEAAAINEKLRNRKKERNGKGQDSAD